MAKDPAFLFYPGDWHLGTVTFTRAQKGAYMDLLVAQFSQGGLSIADIKQILGTDFWMWESKLVSKFKVDEDSLYFNSRLREEMIRRKLYTDSRKGNLSNSHKHMGKHMENENEDKEHQYNNDAKFKSLFKDYLDMRVKIRKPATEKAQRLVLDKLHEHALPVAVKMLEQSIENSWQGIFPVKLIDGKLPVTKYQEPKLSPPDPNCKKCLDPVKQEPIGWVYSGKEGKNVPCSCRREVVNA